MRAGGLGERSEWQIGRWKGRVDTLAEKGWWEYEDEVGRDLHGRKGAGGGAGIARKKGGGGVGWERRFTEGAQGIEKKRVGGGKKAEEGARKVFGVDIHKHMHESKCRRVKRGRINTVWKVSSKSNGTKERKQRVRPGESYGLCNSYDDVSHNILSSSGKSECRLGSVQPFSVGAIRRFPPYSFRGLASPSSWFRYTYVETSLQAPDS